MPPNPPANTTEIGRLIDRIQAGQPTAREELLERSYQRFLLIARRLLDSSEFRNLRGRGVESAEVVNRTFLERIFKTNKSGLDLLDRQRFADPKEFIGAVANHICFCLKDIIVAEQAAGRLKAKAEQKMRRENPEGARDRTVLDAFVERENLANLILAMDELDEQDRQVINLRYIGEMSREDVAATLGVSTKYVTRHARQGLEELGKRLGKPVSFS